VETDVETLTKLNEQFIEACRLGDWEMLSQILSDDFAYLDGNTGETMTLGPYAEAFGAAPTITIDQVVVHVSGNTGIVSARSNAVPGRYARYLDSYERRENGWVCVHACVWRGLPNMD
jgi:ketosteroid isomerase-like protein